MNDGEQEMAQLIETQDKLKKGSETLNKKLQDMEDEQVTLLQCAHLNISHLSPSPSIQISMQPFFQLSSHPGTPAFTHIRISKVMLKPSAI